MKQSDQEMMEKIFNSDEEYDTDDLSKEEMEQMMFAVSMLQSFAHAIRDRMEEEPQFFLAPPSNFSFSLN